MSAVETTAPHPRPTVLVTGGAGFIGRHVAAGFQDRGVRILDLAPVPGLPGASDDVADARTVNKAMAGIELVIHLAAQASVQKSLEDPDGTKRTNVDGTRIVLEEAKAAGVRKVVFASSCAVYGDGKPPLDEDAPMRPLSLYAQTKVAGEQLCRSFSQKGLPAVALRFFNVYGPGQRPDSQYAAVIPAFVQAARTAKPLTIFGDGLQSRDFVHVSDVVEAIRRAADLPERFGAFNVGSGHATTVLQLAERIRRLSGSRSPIVHAPPRAGEVRYSWADTQRAEKALGFRAKTGLDEGLAALLKAP